MTFNCHGPGQEWLVWWHFPLALQSDSSFGWINVSEFGFRSFIIFCLSKIIGKISILLLGGRKENKRRGQRGWEPWWAQVPWPRLLTMPRHIFPFLQELDYLLLPSSFWVIYAFLFSFVCFISLFLFSNLYLWGWARKWKEWNPKLPNSCLVKK